ncbi:hypothetical protein Tco_0934673 [Tanacetum coccineum]
MFGPLYEEYYTPRTQEVIDNSAANTLDNEDTPSSSSIIIEDNDASQIVTSSKEQIKQEPLTPVLNSHSDEQIQEDLEKVDGNTIIHSFETPEFKELSHLQLSDLSTTEPKNIKEAMPDHSWIDTIQDELNQFKCLDVWELVELSAGKNVIKVKWLWKNKTDA